METTFEPGTVERRMAELGARIDRILETQDHTSFVAAVKRELAVWHVWIDEARVQTALGSMEARARAAEATKLLERFRAKIARRFKDVERVTELVPGLRESIERELKDVKDQLSSEAAFTS